MLQREHQSALYRLLAVLLFVLGTLIRLQALASQERAFNSVSEDGYLMLTVARNLALGHGMSTAAGTIPTNGTQPLVTFLWAGVHALFAGDRASAVSAIVIIELIVATLAALCVGRLARDVLRSHAAATSLAWLAAAIWFASPLTVRHTTNGLETGVYTLAIAVVLLLDTRWVTSDRWWRAAALGALFGGLFLARNDAVFFIAAFLVVHLMHDSSAKRSPLSNRLRDVVVMGSTAFIVALPWLLHNVTQFGYVVPISGQAQHLNAGIGENVLELPRVFVEYLMMVAPLPSIFVARPLLAALAAIGVGLALTLTARHWRQLSLSLDRSVVVMLLFGLLLSVYYGFFFAAGYFVSRYLFPISIVSVILLAAWFARAVDSHRWRWIAYAGSALAIGLVTMSSYRLYARGATHPHFQVVEWVASNVDADVWVGAPQSGTLGYFHDRTINLDGKVNPRALEARAAGRLIEYIVCDTEITYLADWYGLTRWMDRPASIPEQQGSFALRDAFAYLVKDSSKNLVVLKRTRRDACH